MLVGRGCEGAGGWIWITTILFRQNLNDSVLIYIKIRLSATSSLITLGDVYTVRLDFIWCGNQVNILALSRKFDSSTNDFLTELEFTYNSVTSTMSILVGDLNIDWTAKNYVCDRYLDYLLRAGLTQYIDKPTRVTDTMHCFMLRSHFC